MGALDDLLAAWRANPEADSTVALCAYLGASGQDSLVREVGTTAEQWHANDGNVMLSVGRMYLDAGMLPEAQAALVSAGKLDPAGSKPFRYLGEVLLRRGDAMRAEKVLARALQQDPADDEARHWHDRASFYIALQKRVGAQLVASEVERALPRAVSIPPPQMRPEPFASDEITNPRAAGAPLPRFDSAEEISKVEHFGAPTPAVRAPRANTMLGVAPPQGIPGVTAPRTAARAPAQPARPAPVAQAARPAPATRPGSAQVRTAAAAAHAAPARAPARAPTAPTIPSPPPPAPSFDEIDPHELDAPTDPFDVPTRVGASPNTGSAPASTAPRKPLTLPPVPKPPGLPATLPPSSPSGPRAPISGLPPAGFRGPPPLPQYGSTAPSSAAATERYDGAAPPPGLVLEHLARVGVFEPGGGAAPAWEQPTRTKSRGIWVMIVAIVLISGAGIGGYEYARRVKAQKRTQAEALVAEIDRSLHSGSVAELKGTDDKLSRAFELDSLSQRAARLWLENRVLRALMLNEESRGIDSAVHRARTVGLGDKDVAFGRIASFLTEGDLAGAAAQLPKWDADAGRDAYFQLAGGAVLERAGDLRAIERYEAARSLDPKLIPADILLARLALLELGQERSSAVITALEGKIGDRPVLRALRALAWVVDPERSETLPANAVIAPADEATLPAPLLAVPAMVRAAKAVQAADRDALTKAVDEAIGSADTPSLATSLGFLAIEAGDEKLARKAALRALGFAALYPRARTLAARVALLGGRIDEAQKAIEELDPKSPEVAVVRAVAAYESNEPADVQAAVDVLGETKAAPAFAALVAAPGILLGNKYPTPEEVKEFAHPNVPWGELIAIDAALDRNELDVADGLFMARGGAALGPVHYLRQARLLRYRDKPAEAAAASERALFGNVTVSLLIERTYDLVAADDAKGALTLIAKYPAVLGPLAGFLTAFVEGKSPHKPVQAQAAARVAKLDFPPEASPLVVRLIALRAVVLTADKRAPDYLRQMARAAPKHPDVALAIKDFGR
jgi:tetratricopeptide (TPR) repeat protein